MALIANPLQRFVEAFRGLKVLVVGDAMVDHYHFGRVVKLSQEAPVPVFVTEREEIREGGAANVSAQLEALGCDVTHCFAKLADRCVKTRYFHDTHQVFRHDSDLIIGPQKQEILKALGALGCGMQALVLSDYSKGWLSVHMCRELIEAAQDLKIPVVVDPKGVNWDKYQGATVLCPNEEELQRFTDDMTQPTKPIFALVHKRGARGLRLTHTGSSRKPELLIPAQARHVYDVTGAGDTVTALIAAGLAVGASLEDSARIANVAAGWVVGEVGTACCSAQTLIELLGGFYD